MSFQIFFNLLAIVFGFVASLFFCVGSARMKEKEIEEISGTFWDENSRLRDFLISLKSDYFCGAIALCIAFLVQFVANFPGIIPAEQIKVALGVFLIVLIGCALGGALCIYRQIIVCRLNGKFVKKPE